jgi:hypothetical protein
MAPVERIFPSVKQAHMPTPWGRELSMHRSPQPLALRDYNTVS